MRNMSEDRYYWCWTCNAFVNKPCGHDKFGNANYECVGYYDKVLELRWAKE